MSLCSLDILQFSVWHPLHLPQRFLFVHYDTDFRVEISKEYMYITLAAYLLMVYMYQHSDM